MKLRESRIAPALLVAVSLSFGAAGCGGGGGSGGLSKADLVKKADAICKRHFETIAAASSKLLAGGNLPKPAAFGQLAKQTIAPQVTAQVKELRALKPSDGQAAYKKWLDQSDAAAAKVAKDPRVVQDPASFKAVNGQADALGLSKDCHIGPSLG